MKKILAAVVVMGLTSVFVLTLFGDNLRALQGMSADSLAGDSSVERRTKHSKGDVTEMKRLSNFAASNDGYDSAPAAPTGNTHQALVPNAFTASAADHLSTFAIDVDTASYALGRRVLNEGHLPVAASVRVEEWVNAFKYELPSPKDAPFAVHLEGAPSPYVQGRTLLKVALQGRKVANADRKPAHLVFLVDTSGSMQSPDRLPLAQRSLKVLVDHLNARDTVALVTYAGDVRVVLEPTSAESKDRILTAIDSLSAGGGTAMGSGLELAYALAVRQVRQGDVTRVLVLTDGDANIGRTGPAEILASVQGYVKDGVTLTTVGFGMGNYRDATLEQLADKGNGQSVYIDSLAEAERVFGRDVAATIEPIAMDAKVQVDFDPKAVIRYRLVGYENRAVADQDFRNDEVDGGELGAGHSVTALYELELAPGVGSLGTVFVRGQLPDTRRPFEVNAPITREVFAASLDRASTELRFATAVALAADHLRGNGAQTDWPLGRIVELAAGATRGDADRTELVALLEKADAAERRGERVAQAAPSVNDGY